MQHTKVIGILNLVIAVLNIIGGVQLFIRGAAPILLIAAATLTAFGVLAAVAGIGLLRGLMWAKVPAYIVGASVLIVIPVGTAFGIYTFVALQDPTNWSTSPATSA